MTRNIPNALSISRIMLSIVLFPLIGDHIWFAISYVFIGMSDVLDGYMARKYGFESELGAKLDSIADLVFYFVWIVIFLKFHYSVLKDVHKFALIMIICIRLLNMLLTRIKYKKVVFIHTLANKVAGGALYLLPVFLLFTYHGLIIWVVLLVCAIAAIEELFITIKYPEPDLNRLCIFCR